MNFKQISETNIEDFCKNHFKLNKNALNDKSHYNEDEINEEFLIYNQLKKKCQAKLNNIKNGDYYEFMHKKPIEDNNDFEKIIESYKKIVRWEQSYLDEKDEEISNMQITVCPYCDSELTNTYCTVCNTPINDMLSFLNAKKGNDENSHISLLTTTDYYVAKQDSNENLLDDPQNNKNEGLTKNEVKLSNKALKEITCLQCSFKNPSTAQNCEICYGKLQFDESNGKVFNNNGSMKHKKIDNENVIGKMQQNQKNNKILLPDICRKNDQNLRKQQHSNKDDDNFGNNYLSLQGTTTGNIQAEQQSSIVRETSHKKKDQNLRKQQHSNKDDDNFGNNYLSLQDTTTGNIQAEQQSPVLRETSSKKNDQNLRKQQHSNKDDNNVGNSYLNLQDTITGHIQAEQQSPVLRETSSRKKNHTLIKQQRSDEQKNTLKLNNDDQTIDVNYETGIEKWLCWNCKIWNDSNFSKCSKCNKLAPFVGKWSCESCTFYNNKLSNECEVCGGKNTHLIFCKGCKKTKINELCDEICNNCIQNLQTEKEPVKFSDVPIRGDTKDVKKLFKYCKRGKNIKLDDKSKSFCDDCNLTLEFCVNCKCGKTVKGDCLCSACKNNLSSNNKTKGIYMCKWCNEVPVTKRCNCCNKCKWLCYNTFCGKLNSQGKDYCDKCGLKQGEIIKLGNNVKVKSGNKEDVKKWQCTKCGNFNAGKDKCGSCNCLRCLPPATKCNCGWVTNPPKKNCDECNKIIG